MNQSRKSGYFPILINLQKYPCLIVGGGQVALRKVLTLLDFNAKITVLSPKFCKPLLDLSKKGEIKVIKKSYSQEYIKDYKIVIGATDNENINSLIHKDCQREGKLLNIVDNPPLCDFILPANIKRGDLTISISSQGKAPFFVKAIKNKLEDIISPYFSDVIEIAGEFRKSLSRSEKIKSSKIKEKAFAEFVKLNWEDIIKKEGKTRAKKQMQGILQNFSS